MDIRLEWNERKRARNLRRHGFDFRDAHAVFAGPTFTMEDDRFDYPERRYMTLGFLRGVPVSLTHTDLEDDVRIISFRKASRYEEALLFANLPD